MFGNSPAASFTVNSDNQITAVTPAGLTGTVDITVATESGTSVITGADQVTIADARRIYPAQRHPGSRSPPVAHCVVPALKGSTNTHSKPP